MSEAPVVVKHIPETVLVRVTTQLLPELYGEWSEPLRVRAEELSDGTVELVFQKVES